MCISPYLGNGCVGVGGGGPRGLVRDLFVQFIPLGSSKTEVFET